MSKIDFLAVVPLPAFDGLPLAATATRALELYSDLATGVTRLAPLKPAERIDIMDECLDLVVPRADLPAGFEFTGVTVAAFRAALKAEESPSLENWETVFRSGALDALRAAARSRVRLRPRVTYAEQIWFKLPKQCGQASAVELPAALDKLLAAAHPGWKKPRRYRLAVELLTAGGRPNHRELPVRGNRFPADGVGPYSSWIRWHDQRLQPQLDVDTALAGYRELQLALPSLDTSYFTNHFFVRNVFAHLRVSQFTDRQGRSVMLLNEVQSDWMRDLRFQRLGRPLRKRWTHIGQRGARAPERIPECPLEKDWLDIAADAFIEYATRQGADVIAWTPGRIQSELNPGLPLSAAERLYDHRLPTRLAACLAVDGASQTETAIEYPTYRRDVLVRWRRAGYQLVRPDGEAPISDILPDKDTALQLYRIQARPVVERLPGLCLSRDGVRHAALPIWSCD